MEFKPRRSDYGSSDDGGHLEYRGDLREWQAEQNRPTPVAPAPVMRPVPAPPQVDNYSRSTLPPPVIKPQGMPTQMRLPPPQSYADIVARGGGGINPVVGTNPDGTPRRLSDRPAPSPVMQPQPMQPPVMQPQPMQPPANPYGTVLNPESNGALKPSRCDFGSSDEGGHLEYKDAVSQYIEAITARKGANEAANTATDQYQADVADFKDIKANEIEEGLASLPEISNLANVPSVPQGINSLSTSSAPLEAPAREFTEPANPFTGAWPDTTMNQSYAPAPVATPLPFTSLGGQTKGNYLGGTVSDFVAPSPQPTPTQPPPEDIIIDDPNKGPINYYTGRPVRNPYTPYSTASGATPLTRTMTPQQFGQAPKINAIEGSQVSDFNDVLKNGISMLPMNGQGDTLTTQVFQSGFRPRR